MLLLAGLERSLDLPDQLARGGCRELDRDTLAPSISVVDEVDVERVIERRVEGMVVVDIGAVDPHPAVGAFRAAGERRFADDVGTHERSPLDADRDGNYRAVRHPLNRGIIDCTCAAPPARCGPGR